MPQNMKAKLNESISVTYKGKRYAAIDKPALRGLDPSCGFIVAFNESDNSEEWVLKIYESDMPIDIEDHKRNVGITSIRIKGFINKKLLVTNERGKRFIVNLETKSVEAL